MKYRLAALAFVSVIAASSMGQSLSDGLGFKVGALYPDSALLRNVFGKQILSYGLGGFKNEEASKKLRGDFSIISAEKNGSKFFLVPVTAAYVRHFREREALEVVQFDPYFRILAGAAYYDYAINVAPGVRKSAKTFGLTAGVELGVNVSKTVNVYARYNYFQKKDDIDFNGITLGVAIAIKGF
jgi:opacity protein-like surface antigen